MEKEKNKILFETIKVAVIVILCVTVLIRVYYNKGVNENQQREIDQMKSEISEQLTQEEINNIKYDQINSKIMTIWMATLDEGGYTKMEEFFNNGYHWCLEYKEMTFVKSLYENEERYPGQVMMIKYEDPDPIDLEDNERYIALYRDGQVKCFNSLFPLTEKECDTLCISEVQE